MARARDVVSVSTKLHRKAGLANHFANTNADHVHAQNLLGVCMLQDFHKTISLVIGARAAVGHKRELADFVGRSSRFRSSWFAKIAFDDMPIEIFADFQVALNEHWRNIKPVKRHAIRLPCGAVYTPEHGELADIFEKCGRQKDLARAARLRMR